MNSFIWSILSVSLFSMAVFALLENEGIPTFCAFIALGFGAIVIRELIRIADTLEEKR